MSTLLLNGAASSPVGFLSVTDHFEPPPEVEMKIPPTPNDIIEFVVSDRFLGRGTELYPRQATLLKVIFLQKDLLTDYDYDVLGEWAEGFRLDDPERWMAEHTEEDGFHYQGMHGIVPDWEHRMDLLIKEGRPWFREVDAAIGRRGSKGYLGGICAARVLWHYICLGDPQEHFGVERKKRLSMFVFAAKKEQARDNQWRDIYQVITGAPCFQDFISRPLAESLTIYSPRNKADMEEAELRGKKINSALDTAAFEILPKESTTVSGRGPASFMQFYDEMAHVVKGVAKADACLDPDTLVLDGELVWRPIGEVKIGDILVGVDEEPVGVARGQRRLRQSKVLGVARNRQRPYRLTFDDGSSVVCSADHRWLHHKLARWGQTKRLRVGSQVRAFVDPWDADDTREGGYLAGFLDGEGFISGTGRARQETVLKKNYGMGFSQNPGPVLEYVKDLLDQFGFNYTVQAGRACHQVLLNQVAEGIRLLGQFRPQRLLENHLRLWEGKCPQGRFKTIVLIERLPEQELVDIETTTGTFIAAGLVSHNSAVYEQATPSLDTFGGEAFIYAGSSTWAMTGKFYENTQQCLQIDPKTLEPIYPEMLLVQLTSWDPYEDWNQASRLPMKPTSSAVFPEIRHPIQSYNAQMKRLERANPETFRVERLSHWATVADAYLDPTQVDEVFGPWNGEPIDPPERGILSTIYIAHGDPSVSGANFGFAMAHTEGPDEDGLPHVVFDLIHNWCPSDFPNGRIDYLQIQKEIETFIDRFIPAEVTFDQFNSVSLIQGLQSYVAMNRFPRRIEVYERTATHSENWKVAETFKTAINMGLIHAPRHDLAQQELKFLQKVGPNRVDHPTMGPIQTKDVADAMMQVVHNLIGEQVALMMERLGSPIRGSMDPASMAQRAGDPDEMVFERLGMAGAHGRGDPTPSTFIPRGSMQRRRTPRGLR